MDTELIISHTTQALVLTLLLSLPPIIVATVVGVLVSLLQALTQVQDQTLGFAIKLIAVTVVLSSSAELSARNSGSMRRICSKTLCDDTMTLSIDWLREVLTVPVLTMARLAACLVVAPFFSNQFITGTVRNGIILSLTLVVYPMVSPAFTAQVLPFRKPRSSWSRKSSSES
jgi:type III secretion HrpO family protein